MNYVRHLFFVLVVVLLPPFALPFYLSPLHASPFALRISRFLPTRSRRVVAPPLTNPSTALYSEPDPPSLSARPASTSTPTTTTEPYKYVSSQGFEVERPRAPSAAAVRRLPRRLFITTVFLTLPLTFLSNFLELTSKLVISSPIPAVADFAASLNLNEVRVRSIPASIPQRFQYIINLPPSQLASLGIALSRRGGLQDLQVAVALLAAAALHEEDIRSLLAADTSSVRAGSGGRTGELAGEERRGARLRGIVRSYRF